MIIIVICDFCIQNEGTRLAAPYTTCSPSFGENKHILQQILAYSLFLDRKSNHFVKKKNIIKYIHYSKESIASLFKVSVTILSKQKE